MPINIIFLAIYGVYIVCIKLSVDGQYRKTKARSRKEFCSKSLNQFSPPKSVYKSGSAENFLLVSVSTPLLLRVIFSNSTKQATKDNVS